MPSIDITPFASGLHCPRCNSTKIVKNGTYKHRQNYRCKDCRKAMSTHTGTVLSGIHKREQFIQYTKCLEEGLTIKQSAKQLGISIATSFAWRHKHLSAIRPLEKNTFQEVKSFSIIKTNYSEKGRKKVENKQKETLVKSLVCTDLRGAVFVKKYNNSRELDGVLRNPKLSSGVAVSVPNVQLQYAVQRQNVNSKTTKPIQKKQFEIAKVTSIKLDEWLYKFRGVATKYLQRYWDWYSCDKTAVSIQWESLTNRQAKELYLQVA